MSERQFDLEQFKNQLRLSYSGDLKWKVASDRKLGPDCIQHIVTNLIEAGVWPSSRQPMVVLSPTANVPHHELQLWKYAQQIHYAPVTVLASDLINHCQSGEQVSQRAGQHTFQYLQADAALLPICNGSVDILWDRKGWLWHLADTQQVDSLQDTLLQYKQKLKPQGAIVIDAISTLDVERWRIYLSALVLVLGLPFLAVLPLLQPNMLKVLPQEVVQFDRFLLNQYEQSTWQLFKELGAYTSFMDWLHEHFFIVALGDGKERVTVLRPKSTIT